MGNKLEQLKRGHSRERLQTAGVNGSSVNCHDPSLSTSTSSLNSFSGNKSGGGQQVGRRKSRNRPPAAASSTSNDQQRRASSGASISARFLFRSSSTSQLSSAYYRCDDPSEDLNHPAHAQELVRNNNGPLSACGTKSGTHVNKNGVSFSVSACSTPASSRSVTGQQQQQQLNYFPTKTVSCENIHMATASSLQAALQKVIHPVASASGDQDVFGSGTASGTPINRKPAFPYAFLRSRLSSLPEEQNQQPSGAPKSCADRGGTLPINSCPVSVPYDVNQIKAKMHQMYLDSTMGGSSGSGSAKRSASTSCLYRESAPAYQHPHFVTSSPSTGGHHHRLDTDTDSGIEKEASSDSSSLYGSDVSSGGNSWEGRNETSTSPPSPADTSRDPLEHGNHSEDGPLPSRPRQPEASPNNNNKWDYLEVKHRMRSRASSLDNVKLGESRKWSLPSSSSSSSQRKQQHQQHQQQCVEDNNNKAGDQPSPTSATTTTVAAPNKERKLASFLRGHVRSVSFGRGSLILQSRKTSVKASKDTVTPPATTSPGVVVPSSVHFQLGQPTHYNGNASSTPSSQRIRDPPASLPPLPPPSTKQFRLIRLTKDETGELGILISLKRGADGSMQGFVIGHIEPGGAADR